jgi:hypothetical protein
MRRHIPLAAAAVAALAATGCGGASHTQSTTPQLRSTSLDIVLRPGLIANAHTQRYRLTCQPAGGSVPHPAAACAALARQPQLLEPLPNCRNAIPDAGSRSVSGVFGGRRVSLTFSCTRGGPRWARLSRALGLPTGVTGSIGG